MSGGQKSTLEDNINLVVGIVFVAGFIGILGVGIKACTTPRPPKTGHEQTQSAPPSDTLLISSARQAVGAKLADPDAAKFRNIHVYRQPNGTAAVCGQVNGKNRAGGYAGFQGFISAGVEEHTWLEEQVPEFGEAWRQLCR